MPRQWPAPLSTKPLLRRCGVPALVMTVLVIAALVMAGLFIAVTAFPAPARAADNIAVVRDLTNSVGRILGAAFACPDIGQTRVRSIADKLKMVIARVSTTDSERAELDRLFNTSINKGSSSVKAERDCQNADHQLADLEKSFTDEATAPSSNPAQASAPPPQQPVTPPRAASAVQGISDGEIRFGIVAPTSGPSAALGHQMKLGIETAFAAINDTGGIGGNILRLIAADDDADPAHAAAAVKRLYEKSKVFAFIGNVGPGNTAAAIPYVLEHRVLLFAPLSGSHLARNNPPDRYVFNYRASYQEEVGALLQYFIRTRRLQPRQIAIFSAEDPYGNEVFAQAARALRAMGQDTALTRLTYTPNSLDVSQALTQLKQRNGGRPRQSNPPPASPQVKAIIMIAPYRLTARLVEATRNMYSGIGYASLSLGGSTELADELMMLGPDYVNDMIITQATPPVNGYSNMVLDYKKALARYFPGERPGYISLEGYIATNILIEAMKRTQPLDTEHLIDTLETMKPLDLGLGIDISFKRIEHQALHKVWGSRLNQQGKFEPIDLQQ